MAKKFLEQNVRRTEWISLDERHPPLLKQGGSWDCSDDVLVVVITHDTPQIGRYEVDYMNGENYWVINGKDGKTKEFIEGTNERFVTHWLPFTPMPEKKKK